MVYLKSGENVITLGKLIGLLFLFCLPVSWARNSYETWRISRNERFPDQPVPDDLLWDGKEEELNYWLCHYIVETRKNNAEMYPPRTLYQLLTGLLRHSLLLNTAAPNFLDKNTSTFHSLHAVIDNLFKDLQRNGVAKETQHTEIVSKEEE